MATSPLYNHHDSINVSPPPMTMESLSVGENARTELGVRDVFQLGISPAGDTIKPIPLSHHANHQSPTEAVSETLAFNRSIRI